MEKGEGRKGEGIRRVSGWKRVRGGRVRGGRVRG